MSILKYHPHRRLRHNSPNSLFPPPAVSPDTAVFLLSKKELLQCLMKTKSVFCMFSRANIRKNGLLQMSCAPFSSLLLGSGLYFFRPQSPRKNAHSLLRYFGIRGICITSLPAARFANLLLKIEKRPTSPELNSTPFVRQYDILSNRWGDLLCQEENRTNDIRRNSRKWL